MDKRYGVKPVDDWNNLQHGIPEYAWPGLRLLVNPSNANADTMKQL